MARCHSAVVSRFGARIAPPGVFHRRSCLLEPPYPSPEDTIAKNISIDRLTVSMELIGCAAYDLASMR